MNAETMNANTETMNTAKVVEEPFIRDCVASMESIIFMETEFYEDYWNSQDTPTQDEYDRYEQLMDYYEEEMNDDWDAHFA